MPSWSLKFKGMVLDGVEVISPGHMNVEKEVFNPHSRVCCPVILFYVYGFKPFKELMLHNIVYEAQWVGSASDLGYVTPEIGCCLGSVLFLASMVAVKPRLVPVPSSGGVPSRSIDGSCVACSIIQVLSQVIPVFGPCWLLSSQVEYRRSVLSLAGRSTLTLGRAVRPVVRSMPGRRCFKGLIIELRQQPLARVALGLVR